MGVISHLPFFLAGLQDLLPFYSFLSLLLHFDRQSPLFLVSSCHHPGCYWSMILGVTQNYRSTFLNLSDNVLFLGLRTTIAETIENKKDSFFFFFFLFLSCEGFLQLWQVGATLHRGAGAALHRGKDSFLTNYFTI